jgi:hypothetical protein
MVPFQGSRSTLSQGKVGKHTGYAMESIEVISLVYKSVKYLEHISRELEMMPGSVPGWDVKVRLVANDPTAKVRDALSRVDVPVYIYFDQQPESYYLNRVYRCYNTAVALSRCSHVCLINSDMIFSKGWLSNLLKHHNGVNIPCSRLVESGKMPSGRYGLSHNLGRVPWEVNRQAWEQVVLNTSQNELFEGGLYMPCVLDRSRFLKAGSFPEGNIYDNGIGTLGNFLRSGDEYFFNEVLGKKFGMRHVTVFDSLVYHIQEGEKDE